MMIEEPQQITKTVNVCLAATLANLCASAATCVMAWGSPAEKMITNPGSQILISKGQADFLISFAAFGAIFGPMATGVFSDYLGRKKTLLMSMVLLIITWSIYYFSDNMILLFCARFLAGTCAGCVYGTLPMYISEISPIHLRGSLGSLLQFFDCIGYLVVSIGGFYLSYENLSALSATIALFCLITFMWMPESPYYLQNKGRRQEALNALRFLRDNVDASHLKREIQDMEASAENILSNKSSIMYLFTEKENLKCVYFASTLIIFQQLSGINVITFFLKPIFEITDAKDLSPDMCAIAVNIVMLVTSILTITSAKIFALRQMLIFSAIGSSIGMLMLGTYFYWKETLATSSFLRWSPVTALVMYIFMYTLGLGPLPWVFSAAIFPSHLKGISCGFCSSFMWLLSFGLTSAFKYVSEDLDIVFWTFGVVTFISIFFIKFQLPEVKGKTFQEIQEMIRRKKIQPQKIYTLNL